jgi:guanine nucleotide exchange factor VAV
MTAFVASVVVISKGSFLCVACILVQGDQYSYRESLRLSEYKVEDVSNRRVMSKDSRWSFQWFLVRKSERTAYTMYARTDELKRKWIKAIQEAL